jgi:hypothetical protein
MAYAQGTPFLNTIKKTFLIPHTDAESVARKTFMVKDPGAVPGAAFAAPTTTFQSFVGQYVPLGRSRKEEII